MVKKALRLNGVYTNHHVTRKTIMYALSVLSALLS
uniref:Uncharacterized protein n=1 Tax=Solanum lycopersicum TaxID=4081 RepID=K4CZY6_SOLLC